MSDVYYTKIDANTTVEGVQQISKKLLEEIVEKENIELEKKLPLKVHFGEMGNVSYVKADNYFGVIDYLKENDIETAYIESTVMYGGKRNNKKLHLQTAADHGFTQLPIIIADGEFGEDYYEVEINKKHFKKCKLGIDFGKYNQVLVLAHFKGHMLAGFGGAIKQLSMGFASKGGKLAMHMGTKPHIVKRKCKKCNICKSRCNEDALIIDEKKSYIDNEKCVGCGACYSICPHKAISIFSLKGLYRGFIKRNDFHEKLVEYAYAAQKDKKHIYFNFAMNITKGCDCEPRKMKPVMEDFGIFISTDPVAIDAACYDLTKERGKAFKGYDQLKYAEDIGLGSRKYNLIEVSK